MSKAYITYRNALFYTNHFEFYAVMCIELASSLALNFCSGFKILLSYICRNLSCFVRNTHFWLLR